MKAPKLELVVPFIDATKEIFSTMAGIEVQRRDIYIKKGYAMFGDVSGVIGLSGKPGGTCAVSMPQALAVSSVSNMLGMPPDQPPEPAEIRDGVGEMINMIAGRAKAILSTTHYRFDITLPTIISGGPHELFQRSGSLCIVILFQANTRQEFTLDVCVAE